MSQKQKENIAVYPGSFDPITLGHLNVIKRASALFDKVIVCVMVNSEKNGLFTRDERVELIRRVLNGANLSNVEVDSSQILVAHYAKEKGARTLIKGLRAVSDYESEVQMAMVNQKLNHQLDTLFFPSNEKYTYLSSTVVKEMARYGADLSDFVPREIIADIQERIQEKGRK